MNRFLRKRVGPWTGAPKPRRLVPCALAGLLSLAVATPRTPDPGPADPGPTEAAAVWPLALTLEGPEAAHRVLSPEPLVSRDPAIARIDGQRVLAVADGETIVDTAGREVRVTVRDTATPRVLGFERDVLPRLTKMGCNTAGCHGAALGQGGFRLSLFGTDPAADHVALTRELGGRRIDRARPAASLFLLKPTGALKHGGGKRFQRDDATWDMLLAWARAGYRHGDEPELVALELVAGPTPRTLRSASAPWSGELIARATYADGSARDVTDFAELSANDEALAVVDEDASYVLERPGEAVFLARFGGRVATASVRRPYATLAHADDGDLAPLARHNVVDDHVNARLEELRLAPSPTCDDATFVRRATLDLTGTLPTPAEVRRFVDAPEGSSSRERRVALIEELLARPAFDTYWAYRLDQWFSVGTEGTDAASFHGWLQGRVRAPWSETAAQLMRGDGEAPTANFYRLSPDPKVTAENVGQIFLGTRWMCAQCHDHPFESFSQEDYYGVAALFGRLRQGDGPVRHIDRGELLFPRTGRPIAPRFPDGTPGPIDGDRRPAIAEWLAQEPQLGRALANRVWSLLMGRGLVEPVDDFRSSNPPTHPALLDELGRLDSIPALVRLIATSAAYERGPQIEANAVDDRFYAHAYPKPLDAEVFVDAVATASGVPDRWPAPKGRPAPEHALELGDVTVESYVLDVCGRGRDVPASTLARELHFLNGDGTLPKLAGVEASLQRDDPALVEDLYLRTLSRRPSAAERAHWTRALDRGPRAEIAADLFWVLLNSAEFATCR